MMKVIKLDLTQHIVDALSFYKSPTLRNGEVVWQRTPQLTHDWMLADSKTPGLLLRLTAHSIAWVLRRKLNGITTRRSLGTARVGLGSGEVLTLAEARRRAEQWRGLMASGRDPLDIRVEAIQERTERKELEATTMAAAFADYKAARRLKNSVGTDKDRLAVQKWMAKSPLWKIPVVKVDRDAVEQSFSPLLARAKARERIEDEAAKLGWSKDEIAAKIRAIRKCGWGPKRPGSLDRIYTYSREAWERAASELKLPSDRRNPFSEWRKDVKWTVPKRRTRWLDTSRSEGQSWVKTVVQQWQASHQADALSAKPWRAAMLDYYICVLIWGTRLTETTLLQWSMVDEDHQAVWLAPETTKTQSLGCVPLTPWTAEILRERRRLNAEWQPRSSWVFPSRQHGKHIVSPQKTLGRINAAAAVVISTHDLRRTLATDIAGERHPLEASSMLIAGAALQHAQRGGVASATTEGYVLNRVEMLRPMYEQRENKLRKIAGLRALGKALQHTQKNDALIERVMSDDTLRKQLLAKLLAA